MKYIVDLMIKLLIENQSNQDIPKELDLDGWLEKCLLTLENVDGGETVIKEGVLEMSFVDKESIRKLNSEHRGKDSPTDVLSFSFLDSQKFPGDNLIGQIFMEPQIAHKQSLDHGVSWAEEIEFLFVHAVLHVFGYDHESPEDFREMFDLQEKIMPDQRWANYADQIFHEYFGQ